MKRWIKQADPTRISGGDIFKDLYLDFPGTKEWLDPYPDMVWVVALDYPGHGPYSYFATLIDNG